MPSPTADQTSQAGIITSTTGERHIPSSQRADGSTRREIKIRPGYRPPEDIETYKNRTAEAWKTRGKGAGVPGAATVDDEKSGASGSAKSNNTSNKNAKRREARRKAKDAAAGSKGEEEGAGAGEDVEGGPAATEGEDDAVAQSHAPNAPASDDPEQEREKEARKLQKKLRQARELREKKDNGGHLLPEQLEKVIKINELLRQLNSLGFDPE